MISEKINQYSREELEDLLIVLKNYKASLKQIGNRTKMLHPKSEQEKIFRIEHTENMNENFIHKFVDEIASKYFPEAPKDAQKIFIKNNNLIGGARIFY